MKRLLILILLVLAGCNVDKESREASEIESAERLTDEQLERLLQLNRKIGQFHENEETFYMLETTSITDTQAKILSEVAKTLILPNISSITDLQAEHLNKVQHLVLDGLTSLTDAQAKSLSMNKSKIDLMYNGLRLNGLTTITDVQAESLSKIYHLRLDGLTSITDAQAESLLRIKVMSLSGARRRLL